MKGYRFILLCGVLVIAQVFLVNYFSLSRWVVITLLPAIILMLPLKMGTIPSMLLAFVIGFAVDFFSNGMLGLTSVALVPVALTRFFVYGMVFGDEMSSRADVISISRLGVLRIALASLLMCGLYLLVYVWVDSAGTVPFWPAFLRFFLSLAVSTPVSVLVSKLLRPE